MLVKTAGDTNRVGERVAKDLSRLLLSIQGPKHLLEGERIPLS